MSPIFFLNHFYMMCVILNGPQPNSALLQLIQWAHFLESIQAKATRNPAKYITQHTFTDLQNSRQCSALFLPLTHPDYCQLTGEPACKSPPASFRAKEAF